MATLETHEQSGTVSGKAYGIETNSGSQIALLDGHGDPARGTPGPIPGDGDPGHRRQEREDLPVRERLPVTRSGEDLRGSTPERNENTSSTRLPTPISGGNGSHPGDTRVDHLSATVESLEIPPQPVPDFEMEFDRNQRYILKRIRLKPFWTLARRAQGWLPHKISPNGDWPQTMTFEV